jgi:Flp pilus assembly protein TadD
MLTHPLHRKLFIAALFLIATVAYLPALRAGFIWDDDAYVTRNRTLRSFEGLEQIWLSPLATPQYYPLVHTSFWLECRFWGANSFGFHLDNVLLHALTAVLLWLVLERLQVPGAPWAAVLFALHPVAVESVAWVTERKNVLCALFSIATLYAYLKFDPLDSASEDQPRRWDRYVLVLVLFVAALLSKTIACTLPAVLLVMIWWKRGRITLRDIAAMAPMFVIGLVAGLLTAHIETVKVGALGEDWSLNWIGRFILAGRVPWFYLMKDLWPNPLLFFYPQWNIDPRQPVQYLPLAGTIVTLIVLWILRQRLGRGPIALVVIFLVALFPAMGFFNVYPMRYSYVADHFQHLALIAFCVGLAALLSIWIRRTAVVATVVAVLALIYGGLTFQHAQIFHNTEILWRDTLAKNDRAWMAAHNLGNELAARQKFDEAIALYQKGLAVRPRELALLNQLGLAYMNKGERTQAMKYYDAALQIDPKYVPVLINLASDAQIRQDYREAEHYARQAIESEPRTAAGYLKLGRALSQQQHHDEAMVELRKAVTLDPADGVAHLALAIECAQSGRTDEAISECRAALGAQPELTEAQRMLDELLRSAGGGMPAL